MPHLRDLDELAERCRSPNAKGALIEALACYAVGAYKSSIMNIWLALVYDIIDKLRELAVSGNAPALAHVTQFDEIQRTRDTDGALKFERNILQIAQNEFELVSVQEATDLLRLIEDRNRFGHPNLARDLDALIATPELVRLHLRNVVEHVLERPPVQGKSALDAVHKVIDSPYFPTDLVSAEKILRGTPAARAKRNLVKPLIVGALASCVRENLSSLQFRQRVAAASALESMHSEMVREALQSEYDSILRKTDDRFLGHALYLACLFDAGRRAISEPTWERLRAYIRVAPAAGIEVLPYTAGVLELTGAVEERSLALTREELIAIAAHAVPVMPRAILSASLKMYFASGSFDAANVISAQILQPLVRHMSRDDAIFLARSASNVEVRGSFEYRPLMEKLIELDKISGQELAEIRAS